MGMIDVPRQALGHAGQIGHENPGLQTSTLSSNTHYFGAYLYADQAKAIRRILFNKTAGTTATFRAALEGFSSGTAADNVVKGGGSPASVSFNFGALSNGLNAVVLDNNYTCAIGEIIVPVLRFVSGTSGAVARHGLVDYGHIPHGFFSVGTPTSDHYMPSIGVEYSDGTLMRGSGVMIGMGVGTFNNGSSPNERGILFTAPATVRCCGCYVQANGSSTSGDFTMKLYDSNNNLLASATHDATLQGATDNYSGIQFWWANVILVKGQQYRLTCLPTTANNVTYVQLTWASAAHRIAAGLGLGGFTSRTDAGAWSENDAIGLIFHPTIDQVEAGEAAFVYG